MTHFLLKWGCLFRFLFLALLMYLVAPFAIGLVTGIVAAINAPAETFENGEEADASGLNGAEAAAGNAGTDELSEAEMQAILANLGQ